MIPIPARIAVPSVAPLSYFSRRPSPNNKAGSVIFMYNHAVFPELYSTWARTYMCRRCGKLLHIPS
jgi:hypothetical protein